MWNEVAYVTGGASGIAKAVVQMLVNHQIKVFIVDRDIDRLREFVTEINAVNGAGIAKYAPTDVADWESQEMAFSEAVREFGRIDYVYPIAGIGEGHWIPKTAAGKFTKPDLSVMDVNLNGVLYTSALAIQQFRRQEPGKNGLRGKIVSVASVCGYYCIPTLPLYTASKHGVTGFVRSYGKYLPLEKITLNSIHPHVVRTPISTSKPEFVQALEKLQLYTPIEAVVETFEKLLGDHKTSGDCFEVGPNYHKNGAVKREPTAVLDKESEQLHELLYDMGLKLQQGLDG